MRRQAFLTVLLFHVTVRVWKRGVSLPQGLEIRRVVRDRMNSQIKSRIMA